MNNSKAGIYLLTGTALASVSMGFNIMFFLSFSTVFLFQVALVILAVGFDTLKYLIASTISGIWRDNAFHTTAVVCVAWFILSFVSITCGYAFLGTMFQGKEQQIVKESTTYKMDLASIESGNSQVAGLISFSSEALANTKRERLQAIEEQIEVYNDTPVLNWNKDVVGTFGSRSDCGRRSAYNIHCQAIEKLDKEVERINFWLSKNEAYTSVLAAVETRKEAFNASESGSVEGSDVGIGEPFVGLGIMLGMKARVVRTYGLFIFAVLAELFSGLCFYMFSLSPIGLISNAVHAVKSTVQNANSIRSRANENAGSRTARNETAVPLGGHEIVLLRHDKYDAATDALRAGTLVPSRYAIKKRYGISSGMSDEWQKRWLADGIVESYLTPNHKQSFRRIGS